VADEDTKMLLEGMLDYFAWLKAIKQPRASRANERYRQILVEFVIFSIDNDIAWNDMFTFETYRKFRTQSYFKKPSHALIGLSRHLYDKGAILKPLTMSKYQVRLPPIYEQYLRYLKQTKAPSKSTLGSVRRVLVPFHGYLKHHKIDLAALKIEHLDAFLAELNKPFLSRTRRTYRYHLRGFLKYLYYERRLLRKDLAPLLKGPPEFAQANPPKFLRRGEVERLFASLTVDTPTEIRTYAMVHLACTLGLRPVEISKVTLDDISFQKAELTIRTRKTNNPAILPMAETALKAVAAYVLNSRPISRHREVFLTAVEPHTPISPHTVIHHIAKAMRKAGLRATTYWLRHSYAQQLLHIGRSIYEIKEMMGHQNIQSTQRYLHIDTEMMRKVIFDETL
jgi:site-specific recombinase XerD